MEHEVADHAKKIYSTAKSSKHSTGEKLKDILIEIFIIVFAVSLSIWFHNWSEHRHEQKEVKEFLKGLSKDLSEDVKHLSVQKNIVSRLQSNYRQIASLNKGQQTDAVTDSLIAHFEVDLIVTRPNIGRYEGFKSSGKLGNIENDSLKEDILVFYEQTIPTLVYGENFVNDLQLKLQDLGIESIDKIKPAEFATSPKIRSMLGLGAYNFENNIKGYDRAIERAAKIIDRIKNEIE